MIDSCKRILDKGWFLFVIVSSLVCQPVDQTDPGWENPETLLLDVPFTGVVLQPGKSHVFSIDMSPGNLYKLYLQGISRNDVNMEIDYNDGYELFMELIYDGDDPAYDLITNVSLEDICLRIENSSDSPANFNILLTQYSSRTILAGIPVNGETIMAETTICYVMTLDKSRYARIDLSNADRLIYINYMAVTEYYIVKEEGGIEPDADDVFFAPVNTRMLFMEIINRSAADASFNINSSYY